MAKLRKNLSKSENSSNFNAKDDEPSFLTSEAGAAFNCLWLAFIEAPIFLFFDAKYHIWIETDKLGYAIGSVLS